MVILGLCRPNRDTPKPQIFIPVPTPITLTPPIPADPAYTYPTTPRGPCTPTAGISFPTLPDAHTDSSPVQATQPAPPTLEVTQRLSDRRETDSYGFVLGRGRAVLWGTPLGSALELSTVGHRGPLTVRFLL